jgi:hypothetical protein
MPTEGVDGASSSYEPTGMSHTPGDEAFLPRPDGRLLPVDNMRVAPLDHHEVLVEFVNVFAGCPGEIAPPVRHLGAVCTIEHVPFDPGSLGSGVDPVARVLHERWEVIHGGPFYHEPWLPTPRVFARVDCEELRTPPRMSPVVFLGGANLTPRLPQAHNDSTGSS